MSWCPSPYAAIAQTTLPAHGTIRIRNIGHEIQPRLLSVPVKAGTTADQVGAYPRQIGGQPDGPQAPFALRGPKLGTSMISPGRPPDFSNQLPAGEYAMLGFQPDSRTERPQTLEGMYGVASGRSVLGAPQSGGVRRSGARCR